MDSELALVDDVVDWALELALVTDLLLVETPVLVVTLETTELELLGDAAVP